MKVQIDVDDGIWKKAKSRAALAGIPVKKYVADVLESAGKIASGTIAGRVLNDGHKEMEKKIEELKSSAGEEGAKAIDRAVTMSSLAKSGAYSK